MNNNTYQLSVVGMGVMGHNLLLNFADKGFQVVGYNRSSGRIDELKQEAPHDNVLYTSDLGEMVQSLAKPRRILLMVPAGKPVDMVIEQLLPHLDEEDLIMDGGNSHFPDTERRFTNLNEKGIRYLGVGVSGGEKGARFGPSIMPGGNVEAYSGVSEILEKASAKVHGEPCVAFLGRGAAGHYVKMVHNGIEYGLMQLISEAYDIMHRGLGLNNEQLHQAFDSWNKAELSSFLIEITADIFLQRDEDNPGDHLIDKILDKAKQKGTGKWTSQSALDLGIPIPTIDSAVMMRYLSALKSERLAAEKVSPNSLLHTDISLTIDQVGKALYMAFVASYAQGFALLQAASSEFDYGLDQEAVARIWRGGCIIRAGLLEKIMPAFHKQPDLPNLMVAEGFAEEMTTHRSSLAAVVSGGIQKGMALPAFASALAYYDGYHSGRLPANLIQAQRDNFGAHTYERLDKEGTFHTEWIDSQD